jgi:cytochrome c oxidase subunit III
MNDAAGAEAAHLAHHFDDVEQQYTAAELGMWIFLATEVLFFGGLFCGYTVYRYWYPSAFIVASHRLDVTLGAINTGILLTSSLTMALAVHAAQTGGRRSVAVLLALTALLGCSFLGIKGIEYHHKFEEHLVPGTSFAFSTTPHTNEEVGTEVPLPTMAVANEDIGHVELFFSFYFAMTGLHALHMIIGAVILGVLIIAASRGAFSASYFTPVEMTGLYWHFVDIVWVFLFPLLYLVR